MSEITTDSKKLYSDFAEESIEKAKVEMVKKILDLIDSGVKTFINDHTKKEEKLEAVVVLSDNYICPVGLYSTWCLNRLYVDKQDKIHLSTWSVAGNFGRCKSVTDGSDESFMESAVQYYNEHGGSKKIISYRIIK